MKCGCFCCVVAGCQAALLQYEHVMIPLVLFLRDNHCSVTLATLLLKLNQVCACSDASTMTLGAFGIQWPSGRCSNAHCTQCCIN